jgi:superoxide dismutase, Fe-Mn family
MAFELPKLPYGDTDLAPVISAETIGFHYGKHHNAYVVNLNNLTKDGPLAEASLEAVIADSHGKADKVGIYNNAAQIWNHTFYWNSMKKDGGGAPTGRIAQRINSDFGSYDAFRAAFTATAVGQFGSGWAWLVDDGGKLKVVKTSNADGPGWTGAGKPLMVIDVWEHAYYVDFRNRRPDYVAAFLDKLVNWDFADSQLG